MPAFDRVCRQKKINSERQPEIKTIKRIREPSESLVKDMIKKALLSVLFDVFTMIIFNVKIVIVKGFKKNRRLSILRKSEPSFGDLNKLLKGCASVSNRD